MSAPAPSITDLPTPLRVDNTLGALLIGGLFASALWGVTSVQTFIYYRQYPKDRLALKIAVAILWILDTFDACLTSHIIYHYLVINYMQPESISIPVWSLIIHTPVTIVTDVFIRCMFSKRIWTLSEGNLVLTSVVWILSVCDLTIGLIITARAFTLASWTQLYLLTPLFYASFVTSFTANVYVCVLLCYYLFKSRTGFRRTDTLVISLMGYIITTGLLPSIDAILGTTMYAVMPTNYIFMAFYFNLAKLYINSYLALLNARRHLGKHDEVVSIHLSDLPHFTDSGGEQSVVKVLGKASHKDLEVAVHTTVDRMEDAVGRAV